MDRDAENHNNNHVLDDDDESGTSIPDVMLLNIFCAHAKAPADDSEQARLDADNSWQPVRNWLESHDTEAIRAAAEQRGESGLTALHLACRHVPPLDIIHVLLALAAETAQWQDSFGWLPIHYACASGSHAKVIKALTKAYPESMTTKDRRGRTPLHFSVGDKCASPDIIFLLSSTGAASYPDAIGMLPFHYACAFGHAEGVLCMLLYAFPEAIKTKDMRQRTPLHFAASNAKRKKIQSTVRFLLENGADINAKDANGNTPLRTARTHGERVARKEMVSLMLGHGANTRARNTYGATPLHMCCHSSGSMEFAQLLLQWGASPHSMADANVGGNACCTPLHVTCICGDTKLVELLLKHGARVDVLDMLGQTPFWYACANGYVDVVHQLLLESGVDSEIVLKANHRGETPLTIAIQNGHLDVFQELLLVCLSLSNGQPLKKPRRGWVGKGTLVNALVNLVRRKKKHSDKQHK